MTNTDGVFVVRSPDYSSPPFLLPLLNLSKPKADFNMKAKRKVITELLFLMSFPLPFDPMCVMESMVLLS